MNYDYPITGTRLIMRRLFKHDIPDIIRCYAAFDRLFYNPVDTSFVENVFLQGELWGAFVRDRMIACCCYFPLDSDFYRQDKSYLYLTDFITDPHSCLCAGYVGFDEEMINRFFDTEDVPAVKHTIYTAYLNTAHMQAFRQGFRYIVHFTPVKTAEDISPVFRCGYRLVKLRGLEKLVVHYIFARSVFACDGMDFCCSQTVPLSDTKKVSALLENGYLAFDIAKKDDTVYLSIAPLITD